MSSGPARPQWLEASVRVNEELAESVSDVMARFASGGVALGYDAIEPDPDGEGTPRGPLTVRAYLPIDGTLDDRSNQLREALWHLSQISPFPEPSFREVAEEDWSLEWKKNYRPIRIGRRLVVVPSWMEFERKPGDIPIRLDPGMAFGTGLHPTTQLCLAALEDLVRPGMGVIDLGCGSGILSIAALRLGAGHALGMDIDPAAVRIARENAGINGVDAAAEFCVGSLSDLHQRCETAPLVLANILAIVLRKMLGEGLAELVPPGGRLVMSGILVDQSEDVEQALSVAGLTLMEKRHREDWVALIAERPNNKKTGAVAPIFYPIK